MRSPASKLLSKPRYLDINNPLSFTRTTGDIGKLAMWLDQKYTEGCIPETVYQKVCRENALRILKID
jgi:hypothetical protein